jgi:hypothetical protein
MLSRVRGPGRCWIPLPQSSPCAAAPSRSLSNMTSGMSAIPVCAGRLSWRGRVAEESSPWRLGPRHDPGHAGPSFVCGLLVFVVLSYLCPSWLPPARRPDSGKLPVLTGTNQVGAHTLRSRHADGAGCKLHPLCVTRRPLATGDPRRVRQGAGATFKCAPGTLTGRAASCPASCQRGLMPLGQRMRRNDARGSAVCAGVGVLPVRG